MMEVRRVALSRFGENAIKRGEPLATIEEVLVPLYLHHRYQVEAAASVLGGQHYIYAMRGDGRVPFTRATAAEQQAALEGADGHDHAVGARAAGQHREAHAAAARRATT